MANRILSPLHFEDMEPHRFEDLARNLLYDFRDWRNIEATGRGGGDDGFDVRAWEKVASITNEADEVENENVEGIHPMNGNLWMIQCKREQQLGPKRIQGIINETISADTPPYGFILVAPANFSKKSYDIFRDALRTKGVMEFYLWGKAELEDMLFLPKNDRILFAFMGISLVSRRRSLATDVKFSINNKNKLLRILSNGENSDNLHESILVRDINDDLYPYEEGYEDFAKKPRWKEYIVSAVYPGGLMIHAYEYFGYIDPKSKTFDYVEDLDLLNRKSDIRYGEDEERQNRFELRARISDYWEHLPKKHQMKLSIYALLPYKDMLVIDDKGDIYHNFPHIFIDSSTRGGLLKGYQGWFSIDSGNNRKEELGEEYERLKVFPSSFPEIQKGTYHKDRVIEWDQETARFFRKIGSSGVDALFDMDGRYDYLNVRDRVKVERGRGEETEIFLRVTHKYEATVAEYLEEHGDYRRSQIEKQVGRDIANEDRLVVFEIQRCYEWDL